VRRLDGDDSCNASGLFARRAFSIVFADFPTGLRPAFFWMARISRMPASNASAAASAGLARTAVTMRRVIADMALSQRAGLDFVRRRPPEGTSRPDEGSPALHGAYLASHSSIEMHAWGMMAWGEPSDRIAASSSFSDRVGGRLTRTKERTARAGRPDRSASLRTISRAAAIRSVAFGREESVARVIGRLGRTDQ